ncbi:hypothetical protein CRUP_023068, partial [Coryphaenoides rupestris]
VRWSKTAGSVSERAAEYSVFNETLRIRSIQRHQGGRYYCKADNNLGSPAIKSIRVDVYFLDDPVITVHQSVGEAKEQFYFERTVFLRCVASSNPPVRYSWRRGHDLLSQGSDTGVEIYEPFFTQGETKILKLKNVRPQDYANYTWVRGGEGEELPRHSVLDHGSLSIPSVTVDDGGVKISCQVEATPPEELLFYWLKNGRPLRSSERMVITQSEGELALGTTNLDIIDLKFTDFGTYTCVASLRTGGVASLRTGGVADVSIDVNISSTTVPPELSLPPGGSPLVCQEGDTVELQCLVTGKPKPIILWYRGDPEGAGPLMPDGSAHMESYDGILRISNVTLPPSVEPGYQEVRQALGRAFSLSCGVLQAHPARPLRYEWKLGARLLTVGQLSDHAPLTHYQVRALNREGYGQYTCDISNEAGAGRCTFLVTEFYYDTLAALWQSRLRVFGFRLQWTQMDPGAVDRILAYRLGIRQVGQSRWWEQEIAMEGVIQKGELLTYNLTELVKPEAYLVRLTPITCYGEGDSAQRTLQSTLTLDKTEHFDWTRHSAATRDTKYTPNTGPSKDHQGSKQGYYMYIETSRPRLAGDTARLLSPSFTAGSRSSSYCLGFYYHMYGKHIGSLGVVLRQKGQTVSDSSVWSLSGNQGDRWRQAKVTIHPTTTFQVMMVGVRGSGIEGDIAIDDITIEEGECKDPPPNNLRSLAPPPFPNLWQLSVTLTLFLIGHR